MEGGSRGLFDEIGHVCSVGTVFGHVQSSHSSVLAFTDFRIHSFFFKSSNAFSQNFSQK